MLLHNAHPGLALRATEVRRLFRTLDESGLFPVLPGELSVAFLSGPAMAGLHRRFMDDPTETDVITFDGAPELQTAGEICVCPDVAHRYAAHHRGSFSDELTLYLVHGFLHLAGFDDRTAVARRRMRLAERRAMTVLRAARVDPRFRLVD